MIIIALTLDEYLKLSKIINEAEGIPSSTEDGYRVETYLPSPADVKHPTKELYYVRKDKVTERYASGWHEADSDWLDMTVE